MRREEDGRRRAVDRRDARALEEPLGGAAAGIGIFSMPRRREEGLGGVARLGEHRRYRRRDRTARRDVGEIEGKIEVRCFSRRTARHSRASTKLRFEGLGRRSESYGLR